MRKTTLLCLVLAVTCGAGIFRTSQRVHEEHEKIAALNVGIGKEQESLRVLNAEWSYLNQPERLERLSKLYLHLAPMKGNQFVKAEDIPMRGVVAAEPGKKAADKKAPKPHMPFVAHIKIKPAPAVEPGDSDPDDGVDEVQEDPAPGTKSFVQPIRKAPPVKSASLTKPPAASPRNFSDLMKNLHSGIE